MRGIGLAAVFACSCGRFGFDLFGTQPGDGRSGDGGSGSSGGGGDGPNPIPDGTFADIAPGNACGTNVMLSDTFSTTTTSTQWTVQQTGDATVTQGGGALTIAFASPIQQNVMAGYQLASTTSFANTCVTVELLSPPASSGSAVFSIGSVNVFVRMEVGGGSIVSICSQGSNRVDHLDIRPYDPVAQRYLRLRAGNDWYWEASPDNVTYSTYAANPCPSVPNNNVLELWAYANANDVNDGNCKYGAVTIVK
jgi:hypothetical protein